MQRRISKGKLDRPSQRSGCWFLTAGVVYYLFGLETKGTDRPETGDRLTGTFVRRGRSWIR